MQYDRRLLTNQSSKQFKLSALTKADYQDLSLQEKQFAEQQFRVIYAEQMSKLSSQLLHKKKILDNINIHDEQQQQNLKDQYEKLKNKMVSIEENRNKKLQEKIKIFKQKDERWSYKLKEIQHKFKQKNRETIQKAKKYREESENYWKNKERRALENSRTHFEKKKNENDVKSLGNSLNYTQYNNSNKGKKNIVLNQQVDNTTMQNDALDQQIKIHQQRSQYLQKQREEQIFQKAVQKMQKINKKRELIKKNQGLKHAEPTMPRFVDKSHGQIEQKRKMKRHSQASKDSRTLLNHQSKQSLQNSIKEHLQSKQRLEEQQFMHRGSMMENNNQRNRREKILKMIKNRVHEMKIETLKKEGQKNNILG